MNRKGVALFLPAALALASCSRTEPSGEQRPAAGALVLDKALVDGSLVSVSHSEWDAGRTADLFDGNPATMARTANANPAILEIRLREPRPLKGISLTTGGMEAGLTVVVRPAGGAAPRTFAREFRKMPRDPTFGLDFDTGSARIESIRVELKDLSGGDGHIHIRSLQLL
jgi:hypothetical protein